MGIGKYNSEGYHDPTTYEALKGIRREEMAGKRAYRPLVYICSPFAGDTERNTEKARHYCRFAVRSACIPLAPHLPFPQFMDDGIGAERNLALFMDIVLLTKCAELWVFGERISKGMSMEIEKAKRKGQPIRWFDSNCKEVFQ